MTTIINKDRQYEGLDINERRVLYDKALHKALEILVSYDEKEVEDTISKGLKPIAAAAGLDRIIVFRVLNKDKLLCGERYRWDRLEGGTAPIDNDLRELPLTPAIKRWITIISRDSCVSIKRSEFKEDEAAFLGPRGVMSILIMPIFTEKEFWGVVTFHDNTKEREFDEDCVAMLRSTARMCVSTIIREEKTRIANLAAEASKRREKMTDTLNKTFLTFLYENKKKLEDIMAAGVSLIADMAEIDRLILYRNFKAIGGLRMSQVYRWDKSFGGTTALINDFVDISYAQLIPNWEKYLEERNSISTKVRLLPEQEAAIFKPFGILSVSIIPIYIDDSFWGFAIFGDTEKERYFDDDLVEMLRSAAFLFANAFIRAEMDYDLLTNIYNKRFFDENIKRILRLLSRAGGLLSLLMIDIDFLKLYNDTYGRIEGDKCLKIVAQTISRTVARTDDFVVRYDRGKFAVVLPNTDERGAQIVADKILNNIRNCKIPHKKNGAAGYLTISIGATTSKVTHKHIADDYVKKADVLLYKSKRDGRNRCSFEPLII